MVTFFFLLKVSRMSSTPKPKGNRMTAMDLLDVDTNEDTPNLSTPSPAFEAISSTLSIQGDEDLERRQHEEEEIANLLSKKVKKPNGEDIHMLTTWWNEQLDLQIFRCWICNREIRGTADLFVHLKGKRHLGEMKKFKILESTDSNQDEEEITQTVRTQIETERCKICNAKIKKTKYENHFQTCQQIEQEGFVLKSEKKCQFCDKTFETLQEAYYHVKTYHKGIKEEKVPIEKEPENVFSEIVEYKLVPIPDVEKFKPNYGAILKTYTWTVIVKDPRFRKYKETLDDFKKNMDAEGWPVE